MWPDTPDLWKWSVYFVVVTVSVPLGDSAGASPLSGWQGATVSCRISLASSIDGIHSVVAMELEDMCLKKTHALFEIQDMTTVNIGSGKGCRRLTASEFYLNWKVEWECSDIYHSYVFGDPK